MLSIVVPFHNEEKNIPSVLGGYLKFKEKYPFELIGVDDASSDNTQSVFKKFLDNPSFNFLKIVSINQEDHRGYGHAIMTGLKEARGEVLAWTHSDLQTDPVDVFRAYENFLEGGGLKGEKIIIKGNRVRRTLSQVVFSFGMAVIASIVLRKLFFEINAQPKLFSKNFMSYLTHTPEDFSLDLFLLYQAKKNGYKIKTINVLFNKRLYGESKWAFSFSSKLKTIKRTIKYIFRLSKNL